MSSWLETLGFVGQPAKNPTTAQDFVRMSNATAEKLRREQEAKSLLQAAKTVEDKNFEASLMSGDAPPTGAGDAYGPSALALANENLNSPDAIAYLKKLNESQAQAIENQKLGVDSAQKNLDQFGKLPVQYDLSPLMNLSDSWFGSNLQKGYKAPSSAPELIGARGQLEAALAKNRMGVTEAEKDRLQQNLTNRQKTAQILNDAAIADLKRKELRMAGDDRNVLKRQAAENDRFDKFDAKYGEPIRGLTQMRGAVENLRDLLSKNGGRVPAYGTEGFSVFRAEVAKTLTAYNRDYAKLGALSGGDLKLLQDILSADESYAQTLLKEKFFNKDMSVVLANIAQDADTSVDTIKRQTERFRTVIPREYDNTFNSYNASKSPRGAAVKKVSTESALDSMKGL